MDRNFLLAAVLSAAVIIGWQIFVVKPQVDAAIAARKAQEAAAAAANLTAKPQIAPPPAATLTDALAKAPGRVAIDAPEIDGSINLAGAKLDDIRLKNFRETVDPTSPEIRLLRPAEFANGLFIVDGYAVGDDKGLNAVWSAPQGAKLTPATPVTLTRRVGDVVLTRTISVDDKYMLSVVHGAKNAGAAPVTVRPFGYVIQYGVAPGPASSRAEEGPIAIVGPSLFEARFHNKKFLEGKGEKLGKTGTEGWVGITYKYWLAAAAPPQGTKFDASLANINTPQDPIFSAGYLQDAAALAPGAEMSFTSHQFAGAKDVSVLRAYQKPVAKGGLGVGGFDRAVDWGWSWMLSRPIFALLEFFGGHVGSWGVSILLLTICIRMLVFPLQNGAFALSAKMKKVQPEMEALKTRFGDDQVKIQQEMMALYRKEKINPVTGCLPLFFQIPVFYALFQTLTVALELRHQPFLYLKDLSAADPTNLLNLFGLLPYDPTAIPLIGSFLHVGLLPLLFSLSMWFQMKLSPPPPDPTQAQIFAMMPWFMLVLYAQFASGLVLYYFGSTIFSIFQQIYFMRRHGQTIDWKGNFRPPWAKKPGGDGAVAKASAAK